MLGHPPTIVGVIAPKCPWWRLEAATAFRYPGRVVWIGSYRFTIADFLGKVTSVPIPARLLSPPVLQAGQ